KEVDRNRWRFGLQTNRLFGSKVALGVSYDDLSDGDSMFWSLSAPFRSFSDKFSWELVGERADQQILQFVHRDAGNLQSVSFWRRAFVNRAAVAFAPVANTAEYVRVGAMGIVRRQEIVSLADTALAVPDSVTAAVGAFVEYRKARFRVVRHFSGFARQEDLDVGTALRLSLWFAPSAFGYESTGMGSRVELNTALSFPNGFARLGVAATALFNGAGLDSGRVRGSATIAVQPLTRQATFVHVEAGMQKNVFPGSEFDLGHARGPRGFGPHTFVGDRTVWGTLEHRVFLADNFADLFGIGFAGFVDYGGAWFAGSSRQVGGSIGGGLRLGMSRASARNVARLDLSHLFGDGWTNKRWVVSFGRGFAF
ncbi:MAG: hypothetical protein OEY63_01190, partial [Gemmatimonadota bacterium]|nr:hypothetical protein [Gemmatimonadota bacterium]